MAEETQGHQIQTRNNEHFNKKKGISAELNSMDMQQNKKSPAKRRKNRKKMTG